MVLQSNREFSVFIRSALLLMFLIMGIRASAQTDSLIVYDPSEVQLNLDSSRVVVHRHTSGVAGTMTDVIRWDVKGMSALPQLLGNADPVRNASFLPGVSSTNEADSGIHIYGCENAHNAITLNGVPVYGATHLLGFFSVFNPSHFHTMDFSSSAGNEARLGGRMDMAVPDTIPSKVHGDISVGLLSTQGTLSIPLGKRNALLLSARGSYINMIYSKAMAFEGGGQTRYTFGDYNATWLCDAGKRDKLVLNLYYGLDKATITGFDMGLDLGLDWGNRLASFHWNHGFDSSGSWGNPISLEQTLFATSYHCRFSLFQDLYQIAMPSYIMSYGYRAALKFSELRTGLDAVYHHALPQDPAVTGATAPEFESQQQQKAVELTPWCDWSHDFGLYWNLSARLKAHWYLSPEKKSFGGVSPSVEASRSFGSAGRIMARYEIQHQFMFQTGFSNLSFPLEFWLLAGRYSRPQWSQNANLSYDVSFLGDALKLSAELYYKRLYNQLEFEGQVLDMIRSGYCLEDCLLGGDGHNFGLNLMLHKQSGDFTGWVSASLGRSLRHFDSPEYPDWYPSNHERIFELNAVASYVFRKWTFGGTFVFSTGTPFTAPDSFYLLNGRIMAHYGPHNSSRLRPYSRMDLSVSYSFIKNERQENGLNLSIYNTFCRKNDLGYRPTQKDGMFSYESWAFAAPIIPTISYYHRF